MADNQEESTTPAAASASLVGQPGVTSVHCPYRRTTDLLQRITPGKMRIGFLIGAGCPLSIRVPDGEKAKALIPEIVELTALVKSHLAGIEALKTVAELAWERVTARGIAVPTIEDILSHIRTLKSLCSNSQGSGQIDGFSEEFLTKLDAAICARVREIVGPKLTSIDTPYHRLASWIRAIPRERPVEVFTTNYDLLLEQALEEQNVPFFDGFVGSDSAFLDLDSMAEDDLPPRWARVWKIHGSVNWWLTETDKAKRIRRSRDMKEGQQLLIYPSHLKYDESRQMPYYAMLDRLRVFLRSEQCVLITCGYSFNDEHINGYIGQGLAANPNATCLGMIFNDRSDAPKGVKLAMSHPNLSLLAADGGVIGTIDRDWTSTEKDNNPAFSLAVSKIMPEWRTKAPSERCKWLLGDFASFGEFLAHQLSNRDVEKDEHGAP